MAAFYVVHLVVYNSPASVVALDESSSHQVVMTPSSRQLTQSASPQPHGASSNNDEHHSPNGSGSANGGDSHHVPAASGGAATVLSPLQAALGAVFYVWLAAQVLTSSLNPNPQP